VFKASHDTILAEQGKVSAEDEELEPVRKQRAVEELSGR
jgi:hypothetical protein